MEELLIKMSHIEKNMELQTSRIRSDTGHEQQQYNPALQLIISISEYESLKRDIEALRRDNERLRD